MNRRSSPFASAFTAVVVTVATVWALFPFYWAIITSIKNRLDWFNFTYLPIPGVPVIGFAPTLDWWMKELGPDGRGPEILRSMTSSPSL